jgi:DNA-binding transcriptional ArsR family regulator
MKHMSNVAALRRATGKPRPLDESPVNETVDLSLRLLERLATLREPIGVSELAREFASSKATVYRHLQTLMRHGFVRQEPTTMRYAPGIKLFILGERLRALRRPRDCPDDLARLRDETGQPATLSALVEHQVVVLRSCRVTRSSISERSPEPCSIFMRAPTETSRWRSVPRVSWSIAWRNRSKSGHRIPSARQVLSSAPWRK